MLQKSHKTKALQKNVFDLKWEKSWFLAAIMVHPHLKFDSDCTKNIVICEISVLWGFVQENW